MSDTLRIGSFIHPNDVYFSGPSELFQEIADYTSGALPRFGTWRFFH
jgi:hypothetical protein